ncbi:MAG: Ppx/GppA family phosphatase, partial [Fusobacteria bacterium]|nr:Ppx/GppA family phosphatase [Fusobacteriota bacterium]
TLVGVAGTITTQVTVTKEIEDYCREKTHMYRLTLEEIEKNLDKFHSVDLEERKKIKGLLPKRADVIVSGTFLLKIILEYFNKKEIVVSENDILEGLMINI